MDLNEMIERQCDNMAAGTQMREFLRDEDDSEPELRELLRRNLEQFAQGLLASERARVRRELLAAQPRNLTELIAVLDRICPEG